MFCPSCRTEYRDGFTKCSDCGVALVRSLPSDHPTEDSDATVDSEGRELLWGGRSSELYGAVRKALDAAGIQHTDVEKDFGILPTFAQTALLIWIDPRTRESARSALKKALADHAAADEPDDDSSSKDLMAWLDPFKARRSADSISTQRGDREAEEWPAGSDTSEPVPDDAVGEFNPMEATAEVWVGEDADVAQFLSESLRGVGVGCVVTEDGGKIHVLVLPTDEARAREIVREVVEGTPPQ